MCNFQQGLSARLRSARTSAKLTQKDMAQKLSITRSAYTYYEMGHTQPDLDCLVKICRVLGVSADYLLGLDQSAPLS